MIPGTAVACCAVVIFLRSSVVFRNFPRYKKCGQGHVIDVMIDAQGSQSLISPNDVSYL